MINYIFSCIVHEVFGEQSNHEDSISKANFLRNATASLGSYLLNRTDLYEVIDEEIFKAMGESDFDNEYRKPKTYATIIHMRLLATLLKTPINIFAVQHGIWYQNLPLLVPEDYRYDCNIYLVLIGSTQSGHFHLMRNISPPVEASVADYY